jgi:hypothetical protein
MPSATGVVDAFYRTQSTQPSKLPQENSLEFNVRMQLQHISTSPTLSLSWGPMPRLPLQAAALQWTSAAMHTELKAALNTLTFLGSSARAATASAGCCTPVDLSSSSSVTPSAPRADSCLCFNKVPARALLPRNVLLQSTAIKARYTHEWVQLVAGPAQCEHKHEHSVSTSTSTV